MNEGLLLAIVVLPFVLGLLSFILPLRLLPPILTAGSVAIFIMALYLAFGGSELEGFHYALAGWAPPLGIALHLDGLALVMISLTSGIALAITFYSLGFFAADKESAPARGFWPLFFFLWASLHVTFLVADLFTLYVCLELISLIAVGAIAVEGGREAYKAALRYLLIVLFGSLLYLLGVALVYAQFGVLDWTELARGAQYAPNLTLALSLMTAGLLLKTAVLPLHFWLPLAHAKAPAPVSALLSALVVKAALVILLRLWIFTFPESIGPWAPICLGILGSLGVLWGSYQAIIQERLKVMVAYSTVAQIGYLFVALPILMKLGPRGGEPAAEAWSGLVAFVVSHGLAKAAFFLVAGIYMKATSSDVISGLKGAAAREPIATLAWGLAGISLIGLPPSSGFIAKWLLLTSSLKAGYWGFAIVLLIGGLMASIYVFRVLWHAFMHETDDSRAYVDPPLVMSLAALSLAVVLVFLGMRSAEILDLLRLGAPFAGGDLR